MCWRQKKHHRSRIIELVFYWKILRSVLRPMVKYGPADLRLPCGQHIWETETLVRPPRLWLRGSASQASDQRWLRPRVHPLPVLSSSLHKSGPLDFGTKNNFPSFLDSAKISYVCFTTSQNAILAELRLPTMIRMVKFTDFVKRATSPKMKLAEIRFHANFLP